MGQSAMRRYCQFTKCLWIFLHFLLRTTSHGQKEVTEMPSLVDSNGCIDGTIYDSQVSACCRLCDRGHGVALPCTGTGTGNDTVCTSCVDGITYSSIISHEESCQPCSHCPMNARPVHRCNTTHNTKCECVDGYWYDPEQRTCTECLSCQPGYEVDRPCAPYQNTHCRPCPKGYYSSSYGYSTKCRLCSLCKPGQVVRTPCSSVRDTECVDANALLEGVRGTDEPVSTGVNLFPVYCSIPALVLFSLVFFVILKRWRQFPCSRSPPRKAPVPHGSLTNSTSVIGSHCKQTVHHKRHSECGDGNSGQKELKPMLVTGDSPAHCIPGRIMEQLERDLNENEEGKNGWMEMAKNLGYTDSRIKSFAKEASAKGVSPSKQFLHEWIHTGHVTIRLLVEALEQLDRADLSSLIRRDVDLCCSKFNNNNPGPISGPVHFV